MTSPCSHLKRPDPGVAVVDGGGQQGLPALRVVFVWQLSCAQFDVQNAVPAKDGPNGGDGEVKSSLVYKLEQDSAMI